MKNISALGCQNYLLQTPCKSCFPSFSWIFSFNLQSVDHVVVAYIYPARSAMDQSWIRSVVVGSAYWSWGACPAGASSCWLFVLSGKQSREVVTVPCLAPLSWVQCQQEGWKSQKKTEATELHLSEDRTVDLIVLAGQNQSRIARSLARSPRIGILEGFFLFKVCFFFFAFTAGQLDFTVATQVFPSLYLISFLPKFPFLLSFVHC